MHETGLLPKTISDFQDADYWKSFFSQRSEAFEWYGEFDHLAPVLEKYLRHKDVILQIGCGNSTLAEDLFNVGYRSITSVDIVEKVINEHNRTNCHPELKYITMDATDLSFEATSFSVVLDKGTLDALMTDDTRETLKQVDAMFSGISRILKPMGRYIIVSLAQQHILQHWIEYFSDRNHLLRVHQVNPEKGCSSVFEGFHLPTMILIATKLIKPLPSSAKIFEFSVGNSLMKFDNKGDLLESVKSAQNYAILCHRLKTKSLDEEMHFDLFGSGGGMSGSHGPKYDVRIVDLKTGHTNGPYAVFIVLLGREKEWLFSDPKGRQSLAESVGYRRLAIVRLQPGHDFDSLEAVKAELNSVVMDYAPQYAMKSSNKIPTVPFLSLGADLGGRRSVVATGESSLSGAYQIEDVLMTEGCGGFRRLIFLSSQNVIQSEARIMENGSKKPQKLSSQTEQRQSNSTFKVDHSILCCNHHRVMMAGIALINDPTKACLVGLGGGCLASFIVAKLKKISVDAVELDSEVVEVARKYFEFKESARLKAFVGDGIDFVEDKVKRGESTDILLLDVAGASHEDGISGPPLSFLEEGFLKTMKTFVHPNGLLVMNLVTRDLAKRKEVLLNIHEIFGNVYKCDIPEEVNTVVFASDCKLDWDLSKKRAVELEKVLNAKTKNILQDTSDDESNYFLTITDTIEMLAEVK